MVRSEIDNKVKFQYMFRYYIIGVSEGNATWYHNLQYKVKIYKKKNKNKHNLEILKIEYWLK